MNKAITNCELDFFLEIGVEEIPSSLINSIKDFIENGINDLLKVHGLDCLNSVSHGSPRRLFFEINGLNETSQDEQIILRGPASKIAITVAEDGSKSFTSVALSFAKKNNLTENDLYEENGYLYGKSLVKGKSLKCILEDGLYGIIAKTPGKRFMRWANNESKFTRPIEWINCFIVNPRTHSREDINFKFEDIHSSKFSYGHRIYGKKAFTFNNSEEYLAKLRAENIILKTEERKASIIKQANLLANSINGKALLDDELLEEICGLIESPKAVLCEFSEKYLEVPALILKTVMKVHQRYIPIAPGNNPNALSHYFIVISNNPETLAEKNIRAGNEKVIIPRFEDACFFLKEDAKTSLENRLSNLKKINFLVGNMEDKAKRLQKMVAELISELGNNSISQEINPEQHSEILKAAILAKSDLDTQLVFEFTELQGEIGGIYAQREGLSDTISKAISEHYMPRFAEDKEPESLGGKLIAIVDKLDNIITYFAAGKIPKGSADPFALRRQANGILQIIIHGGLKLDLEKFIKSFIEKNPILLENSEYSKENLIEKVCEFLEQRLEFVFSIYHEDSLINRSVLKTTKALTQLDLVHQKIHFLNKLKDDNRFTAFIQAANRVINMCKSFSGKDFNLEIKTELLHEAVEKNLLNQLETFNAKFNKSIDEDIDSIGDTLLELNSPINEFFDKVLVNDPNPEIKTNRQNLLYFAKDALERIADFSILKESQKVPNENKKGSLV